MKVKSMTKPFGRALTLINNPVLLMVLGVVLTVALRLLSDFGYVWWVRPIGTLFVFLVGGGLYLIKKHCQRVFGVLEVVFALTVSWISIATRPSQVCCCVRSGAPVVVQPVLIQEFAIPIGSRAGN